MISICVNQLWFSVWLIMKKNPHSILHNLWVANTWQTERNGTLLFTELTAQPRHLGTVSTHTPGRVSIDVAVGQRISGEKNIFKKVRRKKSVSKGRSFELIPKRKRDSDQDLASCCLSAGLEDILSRPLIYPISPTHSSALLMMMLSLWMAKTQQTEFFMLQY